MNFHIETDENEPARTRSIAPPPPDYTSRAVKFRLMMLFAMLIAVVVLMKEAGKPENWKWMGFREQAEQPTDSDASVEARKKPTDSLPAGDSNQREGSALTLSSEDSSPNVLSTRQAPQYPVAAQQFWAGIFDNMSSDQQLELLHFLKSVRRGEITGASNTGQPPLEQYRKLIELIIERRDGYHREAFDRLALLADGSQEKTDWANQLYESQSVWDKFILPAFESALSGQEITVSQLQSINRLQAVLDVLALAKVQDRSSIGWKGDTSAWIRLWERVADQDFEEAPAVSQLQLISQPQYYRGRTVTINGWVRSARRVELDDSQLQLSHYFILWLRPADTNVAPCCVYSAHLPDGFPELTNQYQDLNEQVSIRGLFFKIRSYVDAENLVRESPVVLANNFDLIPDIVPTSVTAWQPSTATLVVLCLLIPVVAALIAWNVYRGTETKPYQPGTAARSQINDSLGQLKNDPGIRTELEKIRELYQFEADRD